MVGNKDLSSTTNKLTYMEIIKKQLNNISSYEHTNDVVKKLSNNNILSSIKVVHECLALNDEYLAEIFMKDEHRTVFLIITKLALHLLPDLKNLKALQCDHLYNIGLFTIKVMHNKYIYDDTIVELYDTFFRYRFQANNLIECLLEHLQNVTNPSLIPTLCLWLDIIVYYQNITRKREDDLKYSYFDPRIIISECIIKQIYNLPNNLRLRGSFLFYLTYIPYSQINHDQKLASMCRQYMLSEMKDPNEWTADTIHCAMGSVCLITKHHSKHFKYDKEYYQLLLHIVIYTKFHQSLVSTWTNDETIIIHAITEYFYENIDNNNGMIITLGTIIDELHKLYENVKYELTKMNICYLILVLTNEENSISDEILLASFQYIKDRITMKWSGRIKRGKSDELLKALQKACYYDSIKDAIIRLYKIDELVDLIENDSGIICDILALLSKKLETQKLLQENHKFINYMMSHVWNIKNRRSLQILRDNVSFTCRSINLWLSVSWKYRISLKEREKSRSKGAQAPSEARQRIVFVRDQIVLSCSNTKLARGIKDHIAHYNIIILNKCKNDTEKEELILSCKCMIVCLNDDYNQYQHQTELILAHKNQVKIIPVVIEDEDKYCPNEPFLKFILEKYSSSSIHTDINELNYLLADKIKDVLQKKAPTLFYSSNESNNLDDLISQPVINSCTAEDLFMACKENNINKVEEYLKDININVLNQRIRNENTALHIASYNGHNEIVRLLLREGASRTICNRPYGLTAYEEARTESTKDLFRIKMNDGDKQNRFFNNDVYIEWTTAFQNPREKRDYLRQKLNRLQKYEEHEKDDFYKELRERMFAYIHTLPLTSRKKQISQQYFTEMEETLDPVFIIKVYTSTTDFYKYYNEYIAQHGIDFFEPFIIDIHVDYSIVKSVMSTIAIIMFNKRFYKYQYCGKTYRGMVLTEKDLYKYVVHSKIINKSFLSTSKSKELAEVFSGCDQEHVLQQTPDKQAIQIAVLCTYIIKNSETALDIETISEFGMGESEVLILPFSIFEVKNVQRLSTNIGQIELEEISDELVENYS